MKSFGVLGACFILFSILMTSVCPAVDAQEKVATVSSDEFNIPDTATNAEQIELAKKFLTTDREFKSEEEYKTWLQSMFDTVLEITDRVMKTEQDDEMYRIACGMRGQVLAYRAMSGAESRESFDAFVTSLENSDRVQSNEEGKKMTTAFRAIVWQDKVASLVEGEASLDSLAVTLDEIREFIMKNPDQTGLVFDLIYPVSLVADERGKPELAGEVFEKFYTALNQSSVPEHQKAAQGLEGTLRFYRLAGQEFQLQGIDMDGTSFDPATVKGKVVLVHFWATWCVPYLTIYPELLTLYNQYHSDGLEYIGYSIDMELPPLRQFLKDKQLPWPVLSEFLGSQNKLPSLREYYGITGVPTFILIGRDGKVVSQYLTIETLPDALKSQFAQ